MNIKLLNYSCAKENLRGFPQIFIINSTLMNIFSVILGNLWKLFMG